MYARIRPRRGTKGQFEAVNPILKEGEMAIETDDNGTGKGLVNIKFGDGVTDYKNLPYAVRGKDISDTPVIFEDDVEFIEDEEIMSGMVAGKIFKLIKKKLAMVVAELANTLSIAQGRNRSYVFQTETELDEWLTNEDHLATLKIGDNLYIVELNVPDYWWDGTQKQRLETVKVNLNEYYNKKEVDEKDAEITNLMSDVFSTEKTYAVGELFIHNNKLYKVTSAIEYPGEIDLDYVEEVTLGSVINQSLTLDYSNVSSDVQDLKTFLQKALDKLFPLFDGKLFYDGLVNPEIVGGWMATNYRPKGQESAALLPTLTIGTTLMASSGDGTNIQGLRFGSVFAKNEIDLTDFNTLTFECDSLTHEWSGQGFVTKERVDLFQMDRYVNILKSGVYTVDVSALSGKYFVGYTNASGYNQTQKRSYTRIYLS